MRYENERAEYKSRVTDDIYKEVIAFANTAGGVIYIGVDDDGRSIGVTNVDETYARLTNSVRDAIEPDVTMFVKYVLQDNGVIRVEVKEGDYKPYYLKAKGMKPGGVYVREGATSVPASPAKIRRMIKDSDGEIFEERRAASQDLTFEEAQKTFKKYNVDFSEDKYVALGLKNPRDNQYSNLATILSDQCRHTTKIAVFDDLESTSFRDAKEFAGSIFRQLDDSFAFLTLCNRSAVVFNGLERIELPDYPPAALREALLNALIHRDYDFSGSVIVNVNEAHIEFISLGGLPAGLSIADIRNGVSQPRNCRLAEIFHRLRLIEAYGTGIRKIYALYKDCDEQPRIETTANTFKLTLPNMNAPQKKRFAAKKMPTKKETSITTSQMKDIADYLEKYGEMNDADAQRILNLKRTRAYTVVRRMRENGLIVVRGRGADKIYKLKD